MALPGETDEERISRELAIRRLKKQEEMEDELARASGDEAINVCIRVRPFNRREQELQKNSGDPYLRSVIEMPDGMEGKVVCLEKDETGEYKHVETFQYTKSFWSVSEDQQPHPFAPVTQEDIFETVGKPVVRYAFVGFHNCVFAYGQTGSGKTYSMMGDFSTDEDGEWAGSPGLIPRLCKELFQRLERKKEIIEADIKKTYDVKLSAIEIYNEQVKDLFWRSTPGRKKDTILKVRMHPTKGAFVDQLAVLNPTKWENCIDLIDKGVQERTVAATLMNDESSRSHSVFQITLTQSETIHIRSEDDPEARYSKPITSTKVSRINLIDLAGSERLKKSGAQGQNLKEAAGINQSLSTLKRVIDALVSNSEEKNPKKQVVVPFRESTLTLLLSHSLGGNSKTAMIACVSPHYDNQEETLLTLRYASRTSGIVNHAKVNEDNAAKEALRLKHQMLALQKRLSGDVEDEESLDLRDQLEVGRMALKDLEEQQKKTEKKMEEAQAKSKREEGARYAAAFYNTLKMGMLQQQKEEMEAQAKEIMGQLDTTTKESDQLKVDLAHTERSERENRREMDRMAGIEQEHKQKDLAMDEHNTKLIKESHDVQQRLTKEIELRYAQKLVNARRRRLAKAQNEDNLADLSLLHEKKLTKVIMEAAEEYEQKVRAFADSDTALQREITAIEKEMQENIQKRDVAEQKAAELHKALRTKESEHNKKIEQIETDWKNRYATMRMQYEEEISALEEARYKDERTADSKMDEEAVTLAHAEYEQTSEADQKCREKEEEWSKTVSKQLEMEGIRMEKELERVAKERSLATAKLKNHLESQIAQLVVQFRRLEALDEEHKENITQLQDATGPLMSLHDKLSQSPGPGTSKELVDLQSLLKEYTVQYCSVRPYAVEEQHRDPTVGQPSPLKKRPVKGVPGKTLFPPPVRH